MRLRRLKTMLLLAMAATQAHALQVLDAVDHAELAAEVSSTSVNRIALENDRIERVIRGPDGFQVEHDPNRGDIFLKPQNPEVGDVVEVGAEKEWGPPGMLGGAVPTSGESTDVTGAAGKRGKTLFLGSEKGFTYRLTLKVKDRGSAQILIRNLDLFRARSAGVEGKGDGGQTGEAGDTHIGELTELVRAVVSRKPLPGFSIFPGGGEKTHAEELSVVEIWQGSGLTAEVVELVGTPDSEPEITGAGGLAEWFGDHGPAVAAAWLSEPGAAPRGGRMGVVLFKTQ